MRITRFKRHSSKSKHQGRRNSDDSKRRRNSLNSSNASGRREYKKGISSSRSGFSANIRKAARETNGELTSSLSTSDPQLLVRRKTVTLPASSSENEIINGRSRRIINIESDSDSSVLTGDTEEDDESEMHIEDLDRLAMRLDGFDAYVLVGLWVSTSCFGDLLISDFKSRDGTLPTFVKYCVIACGLFISLFGLYSTVVFATTILYGKTAVGLNKDAAFVTFMANTGKQRGRAFNLLVKSMVVYAVIVCLVAMNELPERIYLIPASMFMGYLIYLGASDLYAILAAASPIFAPPTPPPSIADEEEEDDDILPNESEGRSTSKAGSRPSMDRRRMLQSMKGIDSVHFNKMKKTTKLKREKTA